MRLHRGNGSERETSAIRRSSDWLSGRVTVLLNFEQAFLAGYVCKSRQPYLSIG
jgi:hypothetical protein